MLTPHELASALNTTRSAFSRVFSQAQIDLPAGKRKKFEAVAFAPLDHTAFQQAFEFAQTQNFLEQLIQIIVGEKLEDGRIAQDVIGGGQDQALQGMRNAVVGLPQPHVIWRGIADALRWTCRVEVNGAMKGTGFLVGPNLVLTAWHVVRSLFATGPVSPSGHLTYIPNETDAPDVLFFFDDYLVSLKPGGVLGPAGRVTVKPADRWYVAHSSCHQDELSSRLPDSLPELEGFWDYCVLRLKTLPGLERRWALLEANAVCPKVNDLVFLFHHPGGQYMRTNSSSIGNFPADQAAALDLRFLHGMNAMEGSSGGPCFDKNFALFGIHQGEWRTGPGGSNRGVPITRILKHLDEHGGLPLPDPADVPILVAGDEDFLLPIVGRDDLQSLVWRSAAKGSPRLISIGGGPRSGKTFCTEVIDKMLSDGDHLKIAIEAETIAHLTAEAVAETICAGAGTAISATETQEFGSTKGAYRKDAAVNDIFDALEAVRANRTVWLILRNLNHFPINGSDVRDLLLLIYRKTKTVPWFRVVLDGFRGDMPNELRVPGEYAVKTLERHHIRDFLLRYAASENIHLQDTEASTNAAVIHNSYLRSLANRPDDGLSELSNDVIDHMIAYQEK